MYQDKTLLPREVIRLASLGTLASRAMSYAELANEVRHFVSRIAGPSLDLMGTSIELLRYEGLVSPLEMSSIVEGTPLEITDAGRAARAPHRGAELRIPKAGWERDGAVSHMQMAA